MHEPQGATATSHDVIPTHEPPVAREPKAPREPRAPREPQPSREPPMASERHVPPAPVAPHEPVTAAAAADEVPRSIPAPAPVAAPPRHFEPVTLSLPPGSGLELVETRHAAPAPSTDEAPPPRPRRTRPQRVEIPSEPLEMVETRKDAPPSA
jgi:hypothetical protein